MGKRKHIDGPGRRGNHTSLLEPSAKLVSEASKEGWLVSVRPGIIEKTKRPSRHAITVCKSKPTVHSNTMRLLIRTTSFIQTLHMEVLNGDFENAYESIERIAKRKLKGAELRIRMEDNMN